MSDSQLSTRDSIDIIQRLLISAPTQQPVWQSTMDEMVERCGGDTDNWLSIIVAMGGVLCGVLLSLAEHEQMNMETVVKQLFNDEYAAMLDMADEIERMHDAAGTTDTSTGTDFVDRELGDGKVDGLEQGQ